MLNKKPCPANGGCVAPASLLYPTEKTFVRRHAIDKCELRLPIIKTSQKKNRCVNSASHILAHTHYLYLFEIRGLILQKKII